MIKPILTLLTVLTCTFAYTQTTNTPKYLDANPPMDKPKVFAAGVVSLSDAYEFGSVFSNNGNEFYYGVNVGPIAEIRCIKRTASGWSKPVTIITHKEYSHNDPFLSPDDKKLFFISDRALDGKGTKKDYDIWYMNRTGDTWSAPVNAGPSINTAMNEYYVSFTKTGTLYFGSNGRTDDNYQVCAAKSSGTGFTPAEVLPAAINTDAYEADVFVAPDESYLIFCSERSGGKGHGDLYISFKQKDGTWTPSKNMGALINTPGHELCPFVTQDGKYFFYTSNKDIYWVDAKVIAAMR